MTAPLLQLNSVTKSFGAVRALKGVSFDLQAGEVHALLGENGAGKSTLVKIITGAHAPDGGTVEIAGHPVRHLTPASAHKLRIACIYQQPALFQDLTVAEKSRCTRTNDCSSPHCWTERRIAPWNFSGIGATFRRHRGRSFRCPVATRRNQLCLGAGARIVIMDGSTTSLTRQEQHLLFDVVRDLRERSVASFTSPRSKIFAPADRVTVLRDGQA
jgi:rhamnose transport system ATP-binding protein